MRSRCLTGKARHPTLLAALQQRAKLYALCGYRLRVYRHHDCGGWHLTSRGPFTMGPIGRS